MTIKAFKLYELPEPPAPFTNEAAVAALAQGSVIQPIVVDNDVIRSGAFKTGVSGWALNPDGTIEAQSATIRGNITALSGAIGGWSIVSNTLKSGDVTLDAGNKQLLFDLATAPLTGKGIFIGLSGGVYQFRAGDPAGQYIIWDGVDLTIAGSISATTGTIGGFEIGADYVRDVGNSFGLASTVTGGDDIRGWAGAAFADRATAPLRWTESGAIYSSSITITGGAISGTTLDIGGADATSFHVDIDGNVWSGAAALNVNTNPFAVTNEGILYAVGAHISGTLTATVGAIGGWIIDSNSIKDVAGLVGLLSVVTAGDDIRFFAGNIIPANAPFSITEAGVLKAQSGTVGGWTLAATTLSATSNGIILDAGNQRILIGATAPILIDGVNKLIQSNNYTSGTFGAGFHLDSNFAEFGNISIRGLIRTAVFQKDVISTVGGNLAVLDGDVLDADISSDA